MDKVTGYIDHVIFRNPDNGYTVLVLSDSSGEELTCVGTFMDLTEGATIEAEGTFARHKVYGRQFQISSCREVEPEDTHAIQRYLGSGAIKGIGAELAKRIVKKFGEDTLRICEEEPERLAEVKGISKKKAAAICAQMEEKASMRKAMIFLQNYGISLNLGAKIYQKYQEGLYTVLKENPYKLAEDISGVGFKIADEIARRVGIRPDSEFRIRSGLLYLLNMAAQGEGHTYLPREELFRRGSMVLDVDPERMEKELMELSLARKVVLKREGEDGILVYPSSFYHLELNAARMLLDLNIRTPVDRKRMEKEIALLEKKNNTRLDDCQREAVYAAAENGVMILTGGPGTGKTTTINIMIQYFQSEGMELKLAAPTGRAAKRMTETTGCDAQTIHRLLELTGMPQEEEGDRGTVHFERNADNPLETDVIIIDEMSMVDIHLMHALLSAVSVGTRLILVGDENQLPSVGAGNVLKDLICSGSFSVTTLTRIFRQAAQSDIVVNAHKIQKGENISLENKSRDFFFLKRMEADHVLRVIVALIREKLPRYVGADPLELQVLTPMRKGVLGVERLNQVLQHYLNPPDPEKKEKESGEVVFREGDKVMQIRNNYQMEWEVRGVRNIPIEKGVGVFNGDTGILKRISEELEEAEVRFEDGRWAVYSFKQLEELELAYAITIHKSQGSEYPAVILPVLTGPRPLMNRNLLYTAVTRAKKCVTIVGSESTVQEMIRNEQQQKRFSSLDLRIREMCE